MPEQEKLLCISRCGCYSQQHCLYNTYYETGEAIETINLGDNCIHRDAHPGILEQEAELGALSLGPAPITDEQIEEHNREVNPAKKRVEDGSLLSGPIDGLSS